MQSIRFRCESCAVLLRVPAGKAGCKGRCPNCQAEVTVPPSSIYGLKPETPPGTDPSQATAPAPGLQPLPEAEAGLAPASPPASPTQPGQPDVPASDEFERDPEEVAAWRKVRLGLLL